jgi:hypothetical protein
MDALSSGGLHEAGKNAVGFQSALRSGSEANLAEDHQIPERLFRAGLRAALKAAYLAGEVRVPPQELPIYLRVERNGVKSLSLTFQSRGHP